MYETLPVRITGHVHPAFGEVEQMRQRRYATFTIHNPYGPVTLTVYTPEDAEWIEQHIHDVQLDLHHVQSAIVTVGNSFVVLEREIDQGHLHFAAQSYRSSGDVDEISADIVIDVLEGYPV